MDRGDGVGMEMAEIEKRTGWWSESWGEVRGEREIRREGQKEGELVRHDDVDWHQTDANS